jgi:sialic acid synthase SpsE
MTDACYLIAEIGLNHNGYLSLAKELVDAAADAGADAVKFQKRDVETLAIEDVLDAPDNRFPSFGSTYREVRTAHELTLEEFREIKAHAETRGVDFLCTPFDVPSVELLEELGVDQYKIASHSVTNLPMLESWTETGKPVYMSSGMCTPAWYDEADPVCTAVYNRECLDFEPKESSVEFINRDLDS